MLISVRMVDLDYLYGSSLKFINIFNFVEILNGKEKNDTNLMSCQEAM